MNLYDIFLFYVNFDKKIPNSLLLWLCQYPRVQQDAFVSFIFNTCEYGLKSKVRMRSYDHALSHKSGCSCLTYYNMLSPLTPFPYSLIGRCIEREMPNKVNFVPQQCSFFEITVSPFNLCDVSAKQTVRPTVVSSGRFKQFPPYEHVFGEFTAYSLLTLLRTRDFNFESLTSRMNVVEISVMLLLVNGMFTDSFLERFLPAYCRTLRVFGSDKCKDAKMNIVCEIYDKFFNRNIRAQFPCNSIPCLALINISVIDKIPTIDSGECVVQCGYVGQRFVLTASMKKLYVFNDFGESVGAYGQCSPFDNKHNYIFECVEAGDVCYFVDIYAVNNTCILNMNINDRMLLLSSLEGILQRCPRFKLACNVPQNDVTNGFNFIKSKSMILRYTNKVQEFKFVIPNLRFSVGGQMYVDDTSNFDFQPRYVGYFLLKYISSNMWGLFVWDKLKFVCVGTFKHALKLRRSKYYIVQVGFNCVTSSCLGGIVYIKHRKYASIYNCVNLEDIVRISK